MVEKRYIIKAHAIERFSERVYGIKKSIDLMTPQETDEIKRAVREDLAHARMLVGAERMVLVSRVRFPPGRSAPKYAGKFFGRADTDMLRCEDRVYFVRSDSRMVVSMMCLNRALMHTMDDLAARDSSPEIPCETPEPDAPSAPSDAREIACSAHVMLTRDAFSVVQTMLHWSYKRAVAEFRKVLSDPRSCCTPSMSLRLCTHIGHRPKPRARYVFHAQAGLVSGVIRRSAEYGDRLHRQSIVDEVVDVILLAPEQCTWVLAHMPEAVYGSFDSVIECSARVFDRMLTEHHWSMAHTMSFIISQFRDPETHRIKIDDEPCTYADLPATADVECYRTPESFLWFEGKTVVDCVLTHEASWAEPEMRCGT